MAKTERLTIKILSSDKAKIERIAQSEGEPVAVIVRRLIRNATQGLETQGQSQRDAAQQVKAGAATYATP